MVFAPLAIACGQLAPSDGGIDSGSEAADAAPDVAVRCTGGTFQVPVPITELNTPANERGLRLSADELTGVFTRGALDAGTLMSALLATRSSLAKSFGMPIMQPGGTTSHAVYPTLTADAQFLFDESYCCIGDPQGCSWLCFSPRIPAPYGDPFAVDDFPEAFFIGGEDPGPFGFRYTLDVGDGFVTSDAGAYYFMRLSGADGGPVAADASTGGRRVVQSGCRVPSTPRSAIRIRNSSGLRASSRFPTIRPSFSTTS